VKKPRSRISQDLAPLSKLVLSLIFLYPVGRFLIPCLWLHSLQSIISHAILEISEAQSRYFVTRYCYLLSLLISNDHVLES
jgi:hypothetical protein